MVEEDFSAKLVEKKERISEIATFSFKPEKKIEFKAGQFAFFSFELGGRQFKKHFTISNSPKRKVVDLTTIIRKSPYKKALNKLPLGSEIKISKPMGEFTLDARKSDKIAFITGGIGITPVRSILQWVSDSKEKGLELVIFYSNRNEERIVFRHELEALAEKIGSVEIVHTITDLAEEEKGGWVGETGFIDRKMVKRYLENEQDFTFYVVGPEKFNQAMKKMLLEELCIKEEMIILENFSGY